MSVRMVVWSVLLVLVLGGTAACGASRENLNVGEAELLGGKEAGDFALKVAEGDALWAQRQDRAKLEAAIASWEAALALESADLDQAARRTAVFDVYVKLSRAHYFLTDGYVRFDADDPDEVAEPMMAGYDRGVTAAEKALYVYSPEYQDAVVKQGKKREEALKLLDDGAIPAMYWYATNLGKWSLLVGLGETLGHVDTIKEMISKLETSQPDFFYHAPLRYFGGYYTKLPFPGGDLEKSKGYFEKAIAGSPNYLGTRVLYAEMYAIKADNETLFKEQLDAVLKAPADVDPEIAAENAIEKRKAQKLLDTIDDHF